MQYFHSAQNSLRAAAGNITLALNTKVQSTRVNYTL